MQKTTHQPMMKERNYYYSDEVIVMVKEKKKKEKEVVAKKKAAISTIVNFCCSPKGHSGTLMGAVGLSTMLIQKKLLPAKRRLVAAGDLQIRGDFRD